MGFLDKLNKGLNLVNDASNAVKHVGEAAKHIGDLENSVNNFVRDPSFEKAKEVLNDGASTVIETNNVQNSVKKTVADYENLKNRKNND